MAKPQEFSITIHPDGKIVLDMNGVQETSYRRILDFLEETVGPVKVVEVAPGDPPERRLSSPAQEDEAPKIQLGKVDKERD